MRGVTTGDKVGKRTRRFNLNLTEKEHKELLIEAKESGLTPQDHARTLLAVTSSPMINKDDTEVDRNDVKQSERRLTGEELALKKRSLEMELEFKERELKIWEKTVELQNLELELAMMNLDEEKERIREKIYWKKIGKRFSDALSKC